MDLIKQFFLEAFPNPERVGCPDEETLMALAEGRLPPGHPALTHVSSCSECFAEYRGCCFELEDKEKSTEAPIVEKLKTNTWPTIAYFLGVKRETANTPVQRVREWIAGRWRRRYSR